MAFVRERSKARGRNNARSLFQVDRIPSDNHIRQTLDPVVPRHLFSLFDELHQACDQTGLLATFLLQTWQSMALTGWVTDFQSWRAGKVTEHNDRSNDCQCQSDRVLSTDDHVFDSISN